MHATLPILSSGVITCILLFFSTSEAQAAESSKKEEQENMGSALRAKPEPNPRIFVGPAGGDYSPDIFGEKQKTDGTLRLLTVDERYGFQRKNELVRVPVFFHQSEALGDPNGFVIIPREGGNPIPYQADSIRLAPDGKITRMHLYFYIDDLPAWSRKQYELRKGPNPGARLPALPIRHLGDAVVMASDDLKVSFFANGKRQGQVKGFETTLGKVKVGEKGLSPRLAVFRLFSGTKERPRVSLINFDDPNEVDIHHMTWGSGPLFSKLVVTMSKKGEKEYATYVYALPKQGDRLIVTEILHLDPSTPQKDKIGTGKFGFKTGNVLLEGDVTLGNGRHDQEIVRVTSGIRKPLETVHKHFYNAIVNEKERLSLFFVPYVDQGGPIVEKEGDPALQFQGSSGMGAGDSQTMRACWGQYSLIFSRAITPEQLWEISCRNFGSLTAVVDEPWATIEDLDQLLSKNAKKFWEIKYWGKNWIQEATISALAGKREEVTKKLNPKNQDKYPMKSIGGDPYSFTYIHSSIVPILLYYLDPEFPGEQRSKLDTMVHDATKKIRTSAQKINEFNFPFMQSFGLALNMHVGAYLMSFHYAKYAGDTDAGLWARNALVNPLVMGLYARGQRPYGVNFADGGSSDVLYQCISDLWMRAIELMYDEDLSIHPAAYARYFDSIDVTSDFYNGKVDEAGVRTKTWDRALMWRAQGHSHRWESWDAAPFLGLFAKASDNGSIGVTEACYWAHDTATNPGVIGWSRLNPIFMSKALLKYTLDNYEPTPLPPGPKEIKVTAAAGGGTVVTWDAVPDERVVGYNVFCTVPFGEITEWKWLNSPYQKTSPENPGSLIAETNYTDPEGTPDSRYFVTSQDKDGRQSDWFPNEPNPAPSSGK